MTNMVQNNEAIENLGFLPLLTNNPNIRGIRDMDNKSISKKERICQVDGCNKKIHGRDYCRRHYDQWNRHGKIFKRTVYDPNEFIIEGDICKIKLYDQKGNYKAEAIIDAEDYGKVKNTKWCQANTGRVISSSNKLLHHVILDFKYKNHKKQVDHIYGDVLDNRKSKLRICNGSKNVVNKGMLPNNTSGYKGVSWSKQSEKWHSYIWFKNKRIHLGYFQSKEKAAQEYNKATSKYHGELAYQNTFE